jgi:hypothetical protein
MPIADLNEAARKRAWVDSVTSDRIPEQLSPLTKATYDRTISELEQWENKSTLKGQNPYSVRNAKTLANLDTYNTHLQSYATGEKPYGEDFLYTKENLAKRIMPYVISDTIGNVTPEQVSENTDFYEHMLMKKHNSVSLSDALQKHIDTLTEKTAFATQIQEHASMAAAKGEDPFVSLNNFYRDNPDLEAFDEGDVDLYTDTYNRSMSLYEGDRDTYNSIRGKMEALLGVRDKTVDGTVEKVKSGKRTRTKKKEWDDASLIFSIANELQSIPPEKWQSALQYSTANMEPDADPVGLFVAKVGQFAKGEIGMDSMSMMARSRKIARDIAAGIEVYVPLGAEITQESGFASAARVLQVSRGGEISSLVQRRATQEERQKIYEDTVVAGRFGRAVKSIEDFAINRMKDTSGIESDTLRFVMDKMVFPNIESSALMIETGLAVYGASRLKGLSKLPQKANNVLGFLTVTGATKSSYQREHFNTLIDKYPNIDYGAAYDVAAWSGTAAAATAALTTQYQFSKIPGLSKISDKVATGRLMQSKLAKFAGSFAAIGASEVAEEIIQDMALDITQEIFSTFDPLVPDINLSEELMPSMGDVLDISLAVLPFALIGGGAASLVQDPVTKSMLSDKDRLMRVLKDEDSVTEVMDATSTEAKVAAFRKHFNVTTLAKTAEEYKNQGMGAEELLETEETNSIKKAEEEALSEDAETPVVVHKESTGKPNGYTVINEETGTQTHKTDQSATSAVTSKLESKKKTEDKGAPEPVVEDPIEIGGKAKAKEEAEINQLLSELNEMGQFVSKSLRARLEKAEPEAVSELREDVVKARESYSMPSVSPRREETETKTETVDEDGNVKEKYEPNPQQSSDKTSVPNTETIGISHAETKRVMAHWNLHQLPQKTRQYQQDLIDWAMGLENLNEKAEAIISAVQNEEIKVVDTEQQAVLMVYLRNIELEIDNTMDSLDKAHASGDNRLKKLFKSELEYLNNLKMNAHLTLANTGTGMGQAFRMRQLIIDKASMDIVKMKKRMENVSRGKATKEQYSEMDKQVDQMQEILNRIGKLERERNSLSQKVGELEAQIAMENSVESLRKRAMKGKKKVSGKNKRLELLKKASDDGICVNV